MPEQYYFDDMWEGEVVLRDRYQFELKSLYSPLSGDINNEYELEFYFFLPSALQINKHTYSREQFYSDLTGLIRFKTPDFTIRELLNEDNPRSPLGRINEMLGSGAEQSFKEINSELKLFGNILRSTVRDQVKGFLEALNGPGALTHLIGPIDSFLGDLKKVRVMLSNFTARLPRDLLGKRGEYIDEFCSLIIEDYATHLLHKIRQLNAQELSEIDKLLQDIIVNEILYRNDRQYVSPSLDNNSRNKELRTYRTGLLKKYVMDVLLLSTQRQELLSRYQHFIGSFAAGVAMFIYMLLFVWQGNIFVINSAPFIIFTTLFYILKDRIKDLIKATSSKLAFELYPDFSTHIRTPDGLDSLGMLYESFLFVREKDLPKKVQEVRASGANREVPEAERLQNVVRYKRRVELNTERLNNGARRYELNDIFRFDISRFLRKASDPIEEKISMDPGSGDILTVPCPKVYHINVVIKESYVSKDKKQHCMFKKIRLIVDKDGIQRIERLDPKQSLLEPDSH